MGSNTQVTSGFPGRGYFFAPEKTPTPLTAEQKELQAHIQVFGIVKILANSSTLLEATIKNIKAIVRVIWEKIEEAYYYICWDLSSFKQARYFVIWHHIHRVEKRISIQIAEHVGDSPSLGHLDQCVHSLFKDVYKDLQKLALQISENEGLVASAAKEKNANNIRFYFSMWRRFEFATDDELLAKIFEKFKFEINERIEKKKNEIKDEAAKIVSDIKKLIDVNPVKGSTPPRTTSTSLEDTPGRRLQGVDVLFPIMDSYKIPGNSQATIKEVCKLKEHIDFALSPLYEATRNKFLSAKVLPNHVEALKSLIKRKVNEFKKQVDREFENEAKDLAEDDVLILSEIGETYKYNLDEMANSSLNDVLKIQNLNDAQKTQKQWEKPFSLTSFKSEITIVKARLSRERSDLEKGLQQSMEIEKRELEKRKIEDDFVATICTSESKLQRLDVVKRDGNCLFASALYVLKQQGLYPNLDVKAYRKSVYEYMKANLDKHELKEKLQQMLYGELNEVKESLNIDSIQATIRAVTSATLLKKYGEFWKLLGKEEMITAKALCASGKFDEFKENICSKLKLDSNLFKTLFQEKNLKGFDAAWKKAIEDSYQNAIDEFVFDEGETGGINIYLTAMSESDAYAGDTELKAIGGKENRSVKVFSMNGQVPSDENIPYVPANAIHMVLYNQHYDPLTYFP